MKKKFDINAFVGFVVIISFTSPKFLHKSHIFNMQHLLTIHFLVLSMNYVRNQISTTVRGEGDLVILLNSILF